MKYLPFLIAMILIAGCSKDEMVFEGVYRSVFLRDECPDAANNAIVSANGNGICLQKDNGIECIVIELVFDASGTFTMSEEITVEALGSFIPVSDNDYSGTYIIGDNTITLNRTTTSKIAMILDDSEMNLDWKVTTTSAGCDRLYQFRKQL